MYKHKRRLKTPLLAGLYLLTFVVLTIIPFMRYLANQPMFTGVSTYYHFNQPSTGLFHLIINSLETIFSSNVIGLLLPVLLGLGSLCLFLQITKPYFDNEDHVFYAVLLLILTPTFINTYVGLHIHSVLTFLSLLSFYLFQKENKFYYLSLVLLLLFDMILGLFFFSLLLFYFWFTSKKKDLLQSSFVLIIGGALLKFLFIDYFPVVFSIDQLFTFLGASFGFSLIILILGFGGFFTIDYQKRSRPVKSLQLVVLLFSIFYEPLRVIVLFLLVIYAIKLFFQFVERKWSLDYVGQLTLILFVCIMLFSTSTFIKEQTQDSPFLAHQEAILSLDEPGILLTHPRLGEFIDYASDLTPFASKQPTSCYRCNEASELFNSQSFSFVKFTLEQENIRYILIDQEMIAGEVWQRDDEGLLYVLSLDDRFTKVYTANGIIIYRFD